MYSAVLILTLLSGPEYGPDRIIDVEGVPTFRDPRDYCLSRAPGSLEPAIEVTSRDGRVEYHQRVRLVYPESVFEVWATRIGVNGVGVALKSRRIWPPKKGGRFGP
jgi:hypothetical protein